MLVGFWCIPQTLADVSLPNAVGISNNYVSAQTIIAPPLKPLYGGNCVLFARYYLNIPMTQSWGIAGAIQPNVQEPRVNDVILLNEGMPLGHVAVITQITSSSYELIEANYVKGKITVRTIDKEYTKIRGFFRP